MKNDNSDELPGLYKKASQDFQKHLLIEGNERVIFSARFGWGKTTFINHFFKNETQKRTFGKVLYNAVHLYPVNYSIAENADIFKYIKYDILLNLLIDKVAVLSSKRKKNYFKTTTEFAGKNLHRILGSMLMAIPKVGKNMHDLFKELNALTEEYIQYDKKVSKSDEDRVNELITEAKQSYMLYEGDSISKLIEKTLHELKEPDETEMNGTKNILIIDDLDRIDPAHIFRILNVFAAHFDLPQYKVSKNKFGFDQILIVCDLHNIRNIFKVRYGIETDFNGYIDKFFSHDVFYFDNKENVRDIISWLFNNTKIHFDGSEGMFRGGRIDKSGFVLYFVEIALTHNLISLRILFGMITKKFDLGYNNTIEIAEGTKITPPEFPILLGIKFLVILFGNYGHLHDVVTVLERKSNIQFNKIFLARILEVTVGYDRVMGNTPNHTNRSHTWQLFDFNCCYYFSYDSSNIIDDGSIQCSKMDDFFNRSSATHPMNFFTVFRKCIEQLNQAGYI